jgi:hypothetical protein
MRRHFSAVLLVAGLVSGSIGCSDTADLGQRDGNRVLPPGAVAVDGVVQYVALEGGCWLIRATEGSLFLPMQLPTAFQRDGMAVSAELLPRDDVATICMIGTTVEILSIRAR